MCCEQPTPRLDFVSVQTVAYSVNLRESHHSVILVRASGLHPARNRYRPVLNLVWEAGMLVISGARGRDIRRRLCGR